MITAVIVRAKRIKKIPIPYILNINLSLSGKTPILHAQTYPDNIQYPRPKIGYSQLYQSDDIHKVSPLIVNLQEVPYNLSYHVRLVEYRLYHFHRNKKLDNYHK